MGTPTLHPPPQWGEVSAPAVAGRKAGAGEQGRRGMETPPYTGKGNCQGRRGPQGLGRLAEGSAAVAAQGGCAAIPYSAEATKGRLAATKDGSGGWLAGREENGCGERSFAEQQAKPYSASLRRP